ncbi:ABC transporter ATP-binding protein [Microbacterium gorillae]|uniref:ABC transporter ATP-binding protein n=1 Tax=Microbacterium gorillae TaxID=1231063 RepID=UPI00069492B3|nr:ABC transporter ATP-binding protein [Microbacterium gorillae]
MMNSASAVSVRDLVVRRGKHRVLDGVSLEIPAGRITGLLGPSGGGKSTLMRAVVGVQRVVSGEVSVLGEPAGSAGLRDRVAYATQAASVYDDLTVAQNLRYFQRLLRAPGSDAERVTEAVGLRPQATQRVGTLSGGQRSRVSLAIAMLGAPEVLVLDEPTVGLDPLLRESLWAVFREISGAGATMLISSHVMDEALRCDEVILLRDGEIIAQTTPEAMLAETGARDPDEAFLTLVRRQRPHTRRDERNRS